MYVCLHLWQYRNLKMASTISLLLFLLILPARISFLPNPSESLRRKKKVELQMGRINIFLSPKAHHISFFLLTMPDRLAVAIFTPGKIILTVKFCLKWRCWRIPQGFQIPTGVGGWSWCGQLKCRTCWIAALFLTVDSHPMQHVLGGWGTQGGMSSEDKGCRRGNKMAEFNASGVWQKFIERLKWSQELLAAMWETCEFQSSLMEST